MTDLPKLEKIIKEAKYDLAIPSISITRKNEQGENFGVSKLGGDPEVPIDFEWTKHEFGNYRFIAQFNLSEIVSFRSNRTKFLNLNSMRYPVFGFFIIH